MNFDFMPELRSRWGYPLVLAAMRRDHASRSTCGPPPRVARSERARRCAGGLMGAAVGWGSRGAGAGLPLAAGVGPHLLPDPFAGVVRRFLRRSRRVGDRARSAGGGPHAERIVDCGRRGGSDRGGGPPAGRARDQEQSGAGSALDSGPWCSTRPGGTAVGLLLPPAFRRRAHRTGRVDLRRLPRRRAPQAADRRAAQAPTQEASSNPPAAWASGSPTSSSGYWTHRSSCRHRGGVEHGAPAPPRLPNRFAS